MKEFVFDNISDVATHLRNDLEGTQAQPGKKYVLLFAYNGTGKTRLSMSFKNLGKQKLLEQRVDAICDVITKMTSKINISRIRKFLSVGRNGDIKTSIKQAITRDYGGDPDALVSALEGGVPIGKKKDASPAFPKGVIGDTLYFNAFTEDLFSWDNDLLGDTHRVLKLNSKSRFLAGLKELEMDTRIRDALHRYADFDFLIDPDKWEVSFSRRIPNEKFDENDKESEEEREKIEQNIKISRGEENIFIWCFFLAIVQLAIDNAPAYSWVKHIYVDDPISSLDEHNAIAVANHLAQLLKQDGNKLKTVISTHHPLFFNVLCNELGKANKYLLSKGSKVGDYILRDTGETPFFHHVATLVELYEAERSGKIYTHHFNTLRQILEKTASFHGLSGFSYCIKKDGADEEGILHTRLVNILSHGNYSLYEPQELLDENKEYFRQILRDFLGKYPFNPELFSDTPEGNNAS